MREIKVTVGGKERKLRYDFNGLCDLERYLGSPMFHAIARLQHTPFADIRDFLWAGIQHEADPAAATPKQVGEWLATELRAGRKLLDFQKAVDDALLQSGVFGDPETVGQKAAEDEQGNAPASQPE